MSFNFGGNAGSGDKKPFSFGSTPTPASNAPTNPFGGLNSTTPAGPPPSTAAFSFGSTSGPGSTGGGGLFGAANNAGNTPSIGSGATSTKENASAAPFSFEKATPSQAPPFSFGTATTSQAPAATSFSFGSGGNATQAGAPAASTTGGLAAPDPSAKKRTVGLFGATDESETTSKKPAGGFSFGSSNTVTTATPVSEPFSFAPKPTEVNTLDSNKPTTGGFSFGNTSKQSEPPKAAPGGFTLGTPATGAENKSETVKPTGGFSFGAPNGKAAETGSTPASGGFSFGGAKPAEKQDAAPAPTAGFSFGAQKAIENNLTPATTATTGGFSFGATKAVEKNQGAAPMTSLASTRPDTTNTTASAPAPASLKNKTMEDIINKWSSDLEKYSQDFQQQAKQISTWDQALLTSGDQISRLYAATVEAEQQSGKVDQALHYIENQQDELSQLLDHYEGEVQNITAEIGVSQPVDLEREKAYSQAEKLVGELDSMGTNLAQMIQELNKSGEVMSRLKEDDPLTSIVKILNNQLQSLNWIEENTTTLNEKVERLVELQNTETPRTPQKFHFGSLKLE